MTELDRALELKAFMNKWVDENVNAKLIVEFPEEGNPFLIKIDEVVAVYDKVVFQKAVDEEIIRLGLTTK